jgi:AcrR family transcriptional regulator
VDVVLEAAAQVFEREGLAATTNRIADRAGVSIGTLYQYFPHKRALLLELAERHVAAAQARLDAEFARLREAPPAGRRRFGRWWPRSSSCTPTGRGCTPSCTSTRRASPRPSRGCTRSRTG